MGPELRAVTQGWTSICHSLHEDPGVEGTEAVGMRSTKRIQESFLLKNGQSTVSPQENSSTLSEAMLQVSGMNGYTTYISAL